MKKILFLICFSITNSFGQSIYFNFSNGTSGQYPLIDVSRIDYSNNFMEIHLNNGNLVNLNLTDIVSFRYQFNTTEIKELTDLKISCEVEPNPSSGNFKLNIKSYQLQKLIVEIFDFVGNKIESICLDQNMNGVYEQNITILKNGVYFIKVSNSFQTVTKKVIIN